MRDRGKRLQQRVELEDAIIISVLVEGKHHPFVALKLSRHVPQADDPPQRASKAKLPLGRMLDDLEDLIQQL